MRQRLLVRGANELSYEIRGIVKKAQQVEEIGYRVFWENIGDPVAKNNRMPQWMKDIISTLAQNDDAFGYCHSKGVKETREFLAKLTNQKGGAQISSEDITFFNGLGDAISKLYQYIIPTSRIIGPSPAYSTHSSAEAAHANHEPITYRLDPAKQWYPDVEDLYLKVRYNPNIVGILIINPDNPTGMVYPIEVLKQFVEIAREFNLFLVCDEIYSHVVYNGVRSHGLSEFIEDLPGIALKGISKEFPWPGSRCGWMEFYNRDKDPEFAKLCETLDNAKMIEVCATKLPQLSIPVIMQDERYQPYLAGRNSEIGRRAEIVHEILGENPYIDLVETNGAFYKTILFKPGALKPGQQLSISDVMLKSLLNSWLSDIYMPLDKKFVYSLLAAYQVCVVPISSFCSDLSGFRVTLLEADEAVLRETFGRIDQAIREFCE